MDGFFRKYTPVALLAVIFFAYKDILNTFFVQDDFWFLGAVQKFTLKKVMLTGVLPDFLRPIPTYWFPLFNKILWGLNPFGYHLTQMFIFLMTVYILYRLLFSVTGSVIAASGGALIFGISKLHLYTLGWISGGIDILAGFFYILVIWLVVQYYENDWSMGWVALFFAFALLSKESTAVLPITIAGFVIFRNFYTRQAFSSKDRRLIVVLFGILAVYIAAWTAYTARFNSPGSTFGLELGRFLEILQYGIVGVLPTEGYPQNFSILWLLIPISLYLITFLGLRDKRTGLPYLALSLLLWLLPTLIFMFTQKPAQLQPYYASFGVFGLAMLFALFLLVLLEYARRLRALPVLKAALVLLLGVYAFLSGRVVFQGVKQASSPSLIEAQYSQAAYDQLKYFMTNHNYKEVVFLDASDLMWWSTAGGGLVSVMFPGTRPYFDGYKGYTAPSNVHTTDNRLVLRQVGENQFEIVQ